MSSLVKFHILFLKNYLLEKQQINSKYSLRKLAQKLEISPTSLSQILGQKRGISDNLGIKIANRLGLTEKERKLFLTSISASHSRSSKGKLKSSLELAVLSNQNNSNLKPNKTVNQIVSNTGPFLLETQEVQNLMNFCEIYETYRYKSSNHEYLIRVLQLLRNKKTGERVKDFIQIIFNEKAGTGAKVYFIQNSNGKFNTYFNNVFDGKHQVTSLVEANQNSTVLFNNDQLPVVPYIHFIHFHLNQHVIGKMEYTKEKFLMSGTIVDYENSNQLTKIGYYRLELKRHYN